MMALQTDVFYKQLKSHWVLLLVGFLVFLIAGFSINAGLVVISVFITYKIVSRLISQQLIGDRAFLFVASLFFYILLLQSVSLVLWLGWHSAPLSITIVSTLLLSAAILWLIRYQPSQPRLPYFKRGTVIALVVTFASLVIFIVLPIRNTPTGNGGSLLSLTNFNVDDGSHLSLLNVRIYNNVIAPAGNSAANDLSPNIVSYPSGWPSANASIIQAFHPMIKVGSETFIAYVVMKSFWLLILIFITSSSAFALYEYFKGARPSYITSIVMGMALLLFTAWFLVNVYFYGFFSFIPQLITVPLFLITLLQLVSVRKKDRNLLQSLMLPSLLAVGSALSWLLLFPIFAGVIALFIGNRAITLGIKHVYSELTHHLIRYLLFYIVIILSVISQVFMIVSVSQPGVSSSIFQVLLLNGGVAIRPASLYTFIVVGIIIFITFSYKKRNINNYLAILYYGFAMLLFTSFIYALQLYKLDQNFYYYFKTFDTLVIAGVILCTVGIGYAVEAVRRKTSPFVALLCGCVAILLAFQFAYPNAPYFGYVRGVRAVSPSVDAQIFSLMQDPDQSDYSNKSVKIFYPSKNALLNEVASTLVQAGHSYSNCYSTLKSASFTVPPSEFVPTIVAKNCPPSIHVTYYVDPSYITRFTQRVNEADLTSRVDVQTIAQ